MLGKKDAKRIQKEKAEGHTSHTDRILRITWVWIVDAMCSDWIAIDLIEAMIPQSRLESSYVRMQELFLEKQLHSLCCNKCIATSSKKLLRAPGITTRSKDVTSHYVPPFF